VKRAELEAILDVARRAADEAAALVRAGFRKHPKVEHKGAVDLVTSYDRDSETLLRERLAPLGIPIVGEEQGGTCPTEGPALFIDPLDGTTNFVHGHPFWCVSIGLVARGCDPILGVVVAPPLRLSFWGWVADDGTREAVRLSDGTPEACTVSASGSIESALLATGFPYDRRTSPDNNFNAFVAIKQRCQAVRRCGSAALDLCLVADGTYDGYWERKLKAWDISGGTAIVRAAGGRVSDFDGGSTYVASGHVVATNGIVHDELLEELARIDTPRQ